MQSSPASVNPHCMNCNVCICGVYKTLSRIRNLLRYVERQLTGSYKTLTNKYFLWSHLQQIPFIDRECLQDLDIGPEPIQFSNPVPVGFVVHSGVGRKSWRPPQCKGTFVSLPRDCIVAASAPESWRELGF